MSVQQLNIDDDGLSSLALQVLPEVTLDEQEEQYCRELAEARAGTYEPINGGQLLCDGLDSVGTHLLGILGEYAVAKYYGVAETLDEDTYQLRDSGGDIRIGDLQVDVKVTQWDGDNPYLLVPSDSTQSHMTAGSADAYVLVQQVEGLTFRLIGFASHTIVTARAPRRFPRHIKNFVVESSELLSPVEPVQEISAENSHDVDLI